jgi:hypothetical protein
MEASYCILSVKLMVINAEIVFGFIWANLNGSKGEIFWQYAAHGPTVLRKFASQW